MQYKRYAVGPYNLHIIKTDKFKTVNVEVSFRRPVIKEEITIRNFLSDLLLNSTAKYPSSRLLAIEAEKLYGLRLSNQNIRIGNYAVTSFGLTALAEKYTEVGMLEKSIKLLLEAIFNPHVDGNKFNNKSVKVIRNVIDAEIRSIKDNLTKYSLIRMLEEMDSKSPISYRGFGYLDDLSAIDESNLYEYYQSMIKSDLVDIFVLGDVNINDIKKIITNNIPLNTIKRKKIAVVIEHNKIRKRLRKIIEKEEVNQSKLSIGCKLEKLTDFERKYVMSIYSIILGGPTSSKLFRVVREKHSLVYYINAQAKVIDNLLIIYAGIDSDKFDKTLKLTKMEMEKIKKGLLTDDDIEKAKQIAVSYIKVAEDSPKVIIDSYLSKELIKADDLEEKKKKILLVTKNDVIKVAKKIKMDTVFLLEGGNINAKDNI